MLKFRTQRTRSRPAAANLGTTLQRKTSWLVMGLLVFVVLVGQQAWRKQKANVAAPNDGNMVDNRVTPAVADVEDKLAQVDRPANEPANADPNVKPITAGDLKLPGAKALVDGETKRYFGDISSKLFDEVLDDAGYRKDEVKPIFTLLDKLAKSDERDIELASVGRKTFVQLYEQSKVYRGEIVTVGGTVERITPQSNPAPYPKQYEVWIKPDGSLLPIMVVCLEIPKNYPAGTKSEVDVSGYFFKRFGYASGQEAEAAAAAKGMSHVYRSAPLILAKTIKLRSVPVVAQQAAAADEGPDFLKGIPLPIPAKYVLPILATGMILLTAMSAWAYKISRTSVMAAGPIMGRKRPQAAPAEVKDLNSFHMEP